MVTQDSVVAQSIPIAREERSQIGTHASFRKVLQSGRAFLRAGALGCACAGAMLVLLAAPATAVPVDPENPPVRSICDLGAGDTAATCMFKPSMAGLPMSARTEFPEDFDASNPDPLNTAEHELFHAIGFAVAYPRFDAKLIATPGAGAMGIPAGSRSYSTNKMANGILMVLVPDDGTHTDPAATGAAPWPATGYNQAKDIMQPTQVKDTRLNANDAAVLNDAFGWTASGIKINIVNVGGTLDATDLAIINNAVAAVNAFYPVKMNSPVFTWSVAEVPEPSSLFLLVGGMLIVWSTARIHGRGA